MNQQGIDKLRDRLSRLLDERGKLEGRIFTAEYQRREWERDLDQVIVEITDLRAQIEKLENEGAKTGE